MGRLSLSTVVVVMSFMPVTTAHAASLENAARALKRASVYVAPGLEGTTPNTADNLAGQLNEGDNIVIVMLPPDAGEPETVLNKLNQVIGHKKIIGLAVGDQVVATADKMPTGEASDLMQRAESVSTSTVETLGTFIRNIHDWQKEHPQAVASKPTEKKGGVLAIALFVIFLLIALGIAGAWAIRRDNGYNTKTVDAKFKASPDEVRELLRAIMDLRRQVGDPDLVSIIETACQDTDAYFNRASDKGTRDEDVMTFVHHLGKVRGVISRYIDVQNNPRYFEEPTKLLAQGHDAIGGFAAFVLDSVRQDRRSELTEFTVDTKILSAQRFR